jgi:hypothetical protein
MGSFYGSWNGKVFVGCAVNSGHSPADLFDTGDPSEHLRQKDWAAVASHSSTAEHWGALWKRRME